MGRVPLAGKFVVTPGANRVIGVGAAHRERRGAAVVGGDDLLRRDTVFNPIRDRAQVFAAKSLVAGPPPQWAMLGTMNKRAKLWAWPNWTLFIAFTS